LKRTLVITFIFLLAGSLKPATNITRLAIAPFEEVDSDAVHAGQSAAAITGALDDKLSGMKEIQVRKSGTVLRYIDTLARAQAGLIDPAVIAAESKGLQANAICLGSVSRAGGRYEVNQRIVSLDSWEIIQSSGFGTDSLPYAIDAIVHGIESNFGTPREGNSGKEHMKKPAVAISRMGDTLSVDGEAGLGGVFAEMLTSELGARREITALESKFTRLLVDEKIFEMSGVIQNHDHASSFRARGADFLAVTELRRFKDLIGITCRINSTATGRMALVFYYEIGSPASLRWAAEALSSAVEKALSGSIGTLKVKCTAADYSVFIDGYKSDARDAIPLEAGSYKVEIRSRGHAPFKTDVTINAREVHTVTAALKKDESAAGEDEEDQFQSDKLRWERRVWKEHR
jgi:TolB-like protein